MWFWIIWVLLAGVARTCKVLVGGLSEGTFDCDVEAGGNNAKASWVPERMSLRQRRGDGSSFSDTPD